MAACDIQKAFHRKSSFIQSLACMFLRILLSFAKFAIKVVGTIGAKMMTKSALFSSLMKRKQNL